MSAPACNTCLKLKTLLEFIEPLPMFWCPGLRVSLKRSVFSSPFDARVVPLARPMRERARTQGKGLMGKAARARAARAAELRGLSATPAVKVLAFTSRTSSVMFSCWCDAQCGRVQC